MFIEIQYFRRRNFYQLGIRRTFLGDVIWGKVLIKHSRNVRWQIILKYKQLLYKINRKYKDFFNLIYQKYE